MPGEQKHIGGMDFPPHVVGQLQFGEPSDTIRFGIKQAPAATVDRSGEW
jgi:hypothetical protein